MTTAAIIKQQKNIENVFKKVLPHNLEFERTILGTIMLEPDSIYTAMDVVRPEDFYSDANAYIYAAMLSLFDKGHRADPLMICEELRRKGQLDAVGGPYYLTQCSAAVTSSANLDAHCKIVRQKAIRRASIYTCLETVSQMYSDEYDVFDVLEDHNEKMYVNTSGILVRHDITMADIGRRFQEQVMIAYDNDGGISGVPSGIPEIDKETRGFQPGTLVVLGARTRHGKSALATAIMQYCSSIKNPDYPLKSDQECMYPTAFMSLEMMDTQVFARMVSAELKQMGYTIPYSRFLGGKDTLNLGDIQLMNIAVERLAKKSMYIDDTSSLNPFELKAKIGRLVRKHGVKMIIVDYAQLMNSGAKSKDNNPTIELTLIAKELKNIARHYNIAIILLSQIDRDTEKREPRPPVISDLMGASALENSADYILLCWRPEVWHEYPVCEDTQMSDKGILYVYLAKSKMSKTVKQRVPFSVDTNSYGDMDLIHEHTQVNQFYDVKQTTITD
jgi:replicative DNA helicase